MGKKIFMITDGLGIGGAEIVFLRLCNELASNGDLRVFSLTKGMGAARVVAPCCHVQCFSRFRIVSAFAIIIMVLVERPDVIVSSMKFANYTNSLLTLFGKHLSVWWVHNTHEGRLQSLRKPLSGFVDRIVFVSESVAEVYAEFGRSGVVIDNLFPIARPSFGAPTSHMTQIKSLSVINVGSLTEQKNQLFFIEVCSHLRKMYPAGSFTAKIFGSGPLHDELLGKIKRFGLADCVVLSGTSYRIQEEISHADVMVHVPKWEGFGMVLVEAIAQNVPYVAFDLEGPREIHFRFGGGLLVPAETSALDVARIISEYVVSADAKSQVNHGTTRLLQSNKASLLKWKEVIM